MRTAQIQPQISPLFCGKLVTVVLDETQEQVKVQLLSRQDDGAYLAVVDTPFGERLIARA